MAKQSIGLGAAPNDGNGDPARDAFNKCNQNFDEIYVALSNTGAGLNLPIVCNGSHPADQGPLLQDTNHQVLFGDAIGGNIFNVTGDIDLDTAGAFNVNETGDYLFFMNLNYGRTGSSQVARVNVRALLNGGQIGGSGSDWHAGQNDRLSKSTTFRLSLTAGDVLTVEIVRDSSAGSANDGGLFAITPTSSGWNPVPSASMAVSKINTDLVE